jgi:thioester reductase-like protein
MGLPGLSINWGAWAKGGMAARLGTQHQSRIESSGMRTIQPEEGMVALEKLLLRSQSQVGVFPVTWSQFSRQVSGVEKMPLLSGLVSVQPSRGRRSGVLEKLEAIGLRERMELFTTHIGSMVAQTLGLKDGQKLEMRQPLFDLGLDSLMAVELKNRLESSLQISLSSTLLFDYPTLEALVEYLADVIPMELSITDSLEASKNLSSGAEGLSTEALHSETEAIAIIGMSCRFPGGANSPEAFWEILNQGIDAISEVPSNRWNIDEYYDPTPDTPGKIISRYGGFLSQVDSFDAAFFGISPREAKSLDPQQRLLLEVSWEAIERANLLPERLFKTQAGVFLGICGSDYSKQLANSSTPESYWGTGNALSTAAGRLSYQFDLGQVFHEQPEAMVQVSEGLTHKWNQGELVALPHKVFSSTQITEAFQYMQQAKNIGKVVIEMPQLSIDSKSIQAEGSYLVTGGLGALGLELAKWMVTQGAKHLVLSGRRAPNENAQKVIEDLETAGASVSVLLGDISREEDVAQTLETISTTSLPPLKGVIHAAGLLDDGLVQNLTWQRFTKVMAPKVQGTWNLHQLTKDLPLDFFVCFSSMAAILGAPGQANYSAANSFMDALVHYRRGLGLPGLSINWGGWGAVGMTARLDTVNRKRLESSGVTLIETERGMQALESLLSESLSQVAVLPVNWSKFLKALPRDQKTIFIENLISTESSSSKKSAFREQLEGAVIAERQELLTNHVRSLIAKTLGWPDPQKIAMHEPFIDLGLDSLMTVELKNRLESSLETNLSSTLLFDYPTLKALVEYLPDVIPLEFSVTDSSDKEDNSGEEIDFKAEVIVDPTIVISTTVKQNIVEPQNIFLTGATGFIGTYLLDQLLQKTSANIYCLIRANDIDSAKQKLKDKLESYWLWDEEKFGSRVIPVVGDLSSKLFGLPTEEFDFLANQIDVIYHSGAWTNHLYPYSILKPTNVIGTQEVLRLAGQTYVKPVHFMSTYIVLLSSTKEQGTAILESEPLSDEANNLTNGYFQSKWVAEKLVAAARELGIPTSIYRLTTITADANSGASRIDDIVCRYVMGCIELGMVPILEGKLENWVPINETTKAVVHLSQQEGSLDKTFNLVNPKSTSWNNVFDFICSLVPSVKRVSSSDWQIALSNHPENSVYPYFFGVQAGTGQLTEKESDILSGVTIDDRDTKNGLLGSEIAFSSIDKEYLEKMLAYLNKSGFINLPS